ncbi:hypothetical protein HO133_003813 [Letharia lupina]|uniref:Uncharacterized protein n=1 Tax=Letharia lupina TaxID=560253 RepID=A0A8H6CAJ9_9LECA|nr:uncharacterized protein HO133_003813 [Letharia lupina]KAF6219988.1 hypothetical protein HO133_003813 [Letharia lupina]
MHSFLCFVSVILLTSLPALGQVDSDPLDSEVDTSVPPTLTAQPTNTGSRTYQVNPADSTESVGTQNKLGTLLYGYDGCDNADWEEYYYGYIDEGYYDSWLIANAAGVKSGINFNSAPAVEYLGPPGLNGPQQKQMQAVFANMATMIYSYKNPVQHWLHVRCDDPLKRCQRRPPGNPCVPNPQNPGQQPRPTPFAYSRNSDPDDGYPMINFCRGYFKRASLASKLATGTALPVPDRYNLANYNCRAQTFFHELTHLDLAADSPSPNPYVNDLTIAIDLNSGTGIPATVYTVAYGTANAKILARYQENTGYYTQQNADNLAYYALALYVMSKNGNIYPHLPLVTSELNGPPWKDVPIGTVAEFITGGDKTYLNGTADQLAALGIEISSSTDDQDYPGCVDNENQLGPKAGTALTISALAPSSAYPSDYISSVSSWLSDLGVQTIATPPSTKTTTTKPTKPTTSSSTTTTTSPQASPTYAKGTCSFHLDEYWDCDTDDKDLYATLKLLDNDKNVIGQTDNDPSVLGVSINADNSLSLQSKLPYPLVIVGEHQGDYVRFTYDHLSWTSNTPSGGAKCKAGGWNPRGGPVCDGGKAGILTNSERQMDCSFPC